MKSPSMPKPSAEEVEAQRLNNEMIRKRNAQLDAEEAERKRETERQMSAIAGNRVGMRSLLSNDWAGFRRGDLGAR